VVTTTEWAEHWHLDCPRFAETRQKLLPDPIGLVPLLGEVGCAKGWGNPRGEGGCIRAAKLCGEIMPRALDLMWRHRTDKASREDVGGEIDSD